MAEEAAQPPEAIGVWHDVTAEDPNIVSNNEEKHGNQASPLDIFNLVHSKKRTQQGKSYITQHGLDVPLQLSHLFKRPIVRQWIHGDNLFREKDEHLPTRMELFFDLMFAGIAHLLAESALEDVPRYTVLKFVLVYYPSFSVWNEVRMFLNMSGTDDALERLGVLLTMLVLVGYSANGSAVHIGPADDLPVGKMLGNVYYFAEGYTKAFKSAVAFYLVARLTRIVLCVYYGLRLPSFRVAMFVHASVRICVSALYIPIVKVYDDGTVIGLLFAAMGLEIATPYIVMFILRVADKISTRYGHKLFLPAISQAHAMERFLQFTVVLIGEMIISSTFSAFPNSQGLDAKYGRSTLSIVTAFMLAWLYFDVDSSRTFQHALRRHAVTSMLFSTMHFPLTGSIIFAGAAVKALVTEKEVERRTLNWYLCGSVGVTLTCIGAIGALHRCLDKAKTGLLPRDVRLLWRFCAAALIICLPLMSHWDQPRDLIGVIASILTFTVFLETFSKVGTVGRRFNETNAEIVHRSKINKDVLSDPVRLEAAINARERLRDMNALRSDNDADAAALRDPSTLRLRTRPLLARNLDWHPYGGLSHDEQGEEDVGMESELGQLECKELSQGQRWAHAA